MKAGLPPGSHAADSTAALWAARLESGELSAADRETLRLWLEQDPAHRWRLAHFQHYSAELDLALPALAAAGKVRVAPPPPARRAWRWGLAALGAAALGVLVLGLPWRHAAAPAGLAYATRVAERQSVKLADGTRADLNAQTSLAVDFRPAERRVRLDHGEALFTVAKNPARPFVVETPAGRVKVTGTVFDVRVDAAGRLDVSVLEGHVEVTPAGGAGESTPLRLTAGDHLVLAAGRMARDWLPPEAAADAAAWRVGQAVFIQEPLAAALERFATFHGRTITVAPTVAQLTIGGRYSLDDLDGFLAGLERTLPVRVERGAEGTVAVGPR